MTKKYNYNDIKPYGKEKTPYDANIKIKPNYKVGEKIVNIDGGIHHGLKGTIVDIDVTPRMFNENIYKIHYSKDLYELLAEGEFEIIEEKK